MWIKLSAPPRLLPPCKNRELIIFAGMAELADAHGSGPCESNFMQVQVLLPAPYGSIAQLGEHLPYKQRVTGSSPVVPTKKEYRFSVLFFYVLALIQLIVSAFASILYLQKTKKGCLSGVSFLVHNALKNNG